MLRVHGSGFGFRVEGVGCIVQRLGAGLGFRGGWWWGFAMVLRFAFALRDSLIATGCVYYEKAESEAQRYCINNGSKQRARPKGLNLKVR